MKSFLTVCCLLPSLLFAQTQLKLSVWLQGPYDGGKMNPVPLEVLLSPLKLLIRFQWRFTRFLDLSFLKPHGYNKMATSFQKMEMRNCLLK